MKSLLESVYSKLNMVNQFVDSDADILAILGGAYEEITFTGLGANNEDALNESSQWLDCRLYTSVHKLRISYINQKSYVSRATFYRLFDRLQDVLVYQCDRIYSQLEKALQSNEIQTKQDFFLLLIEKWMVQGVLLPTLVEHNLTGILYDTQMKHRDFMLSLIHISGPFQQLTV